MEVSERKSLLSKSESNKERSQKSKSEAQKMTAKSSAEDSKRAESMVSTRTEGGTRTKRPKVKMADVRQFEKGPLGWLLSIGYMIAVWSIGAVVMAIMMYFLMQRVNDGPLYFGKNTFIGGTPVAVFEPNPTRFDKKIRGQIEFDTNKLDTYVNYLVRYKKIIAGEYNNEKNTNIVCNEKSEFAANGAVTNETCRDSFEDRDDEASSNEYGDCALTKDNLERADLGFSEGKPCIMLRLTRILGWFPDFEEKPEDLGINQMNSADALKMNRTCPQGEPDCCHKKRISFICEGAEYNQYPADGMNTCALPYWNQPGYQSPFVMMQFDLRTNGTKLNGTSIDIKCRPNLPSIKNLNNDKTNEVKFKLKIKE